MRARRLAEKALTEAGVADPRGDARRLFDWAYGIGENAPENQNRDAPNDMTLETFEIAISDRVARKPVSQIIGRRAFWRHDFEVTSEVLDPRPETETLVEAALSEPFTRVLDLGTGSGCIAISLLADRPKAIGLATDIESAALSLAMRNAERLGVSKRLDTAQSNWFDEVLGDFDLIVSNPPYIAASELADLQPEVRDWEPRQALSDQGDGLSAYRAIAAGARGHLNAGGRVLVEIGPTQAKIVGRFFTDAGLAGVDVIPDLDGRDRVVLARNPA